MSSASVTVLSIEVKLERDKQDNKIKVYVKDPYSKDLEKTFELMDDEIKLINETEIIGYKK